jgi:serine/threonine protein kinase
MGPAEMDSREQSNLVRKIYAAALQRDPEERPGYLDHACEGTPWLRSRVDALLASHSGEFDDAMVTKPVAAAAADPGDVDGRVVGPYVIRRELGRGGMGVVYLADDTQLSRRVALKALTPAVAREPGSRERLKLEARAAALLAHPGIATVYALEEIDHELYLACEYVPGEPLRAMLVSGPLPITQVVRIGLQLARALAEAHAHGIVHRDIKPENVVQTPSGVIKVLDFGLARADFAVETKLTQTGMILGTPAYMAPEQALGERVDFRTDLFAMGLLLYELATGANPFVAKTVRATIARIVEIEPPAVSRLRGDSVPALDRIIATCLRKEPDERYRSTQDAIADLERLDAALTSGAGAAPAGRLRSSGSIPSIDRPMKLSASWWWERHQAIVSLIYIALLYPDWLVRLFLPGVWGVAFMGAALAAAAATVSLRMHLLFIARYCADELPAQLPRSTLGIRASDTVFAVAQVSAAVVIAAGHPEFAMLLVAAAVALLVVSFVVEPATTRAAFGGRR